MAIARIKNEHAPSGYCADYTNIVFEHAPSGYDTNKKRTRAFGYHTNLTNIFGFSIFFRIFVWMSRATPDPPQIASQKQRTVAYVSKDVRLLFS